MPLLIERVNKVREACFAMIDESAKKLANRSTTFRDTQSLGKTEKVSGMRILFWNTSKNKNNDIIARMIEEYSVDFIALAEYSEAADKLINLLNNGGDAYVKYLNIGAEDLTLIGRVKEVCQANQEKHYSIQIIKGNLLICCAHMPSRIYEQSDDRRMLIMRRMISDLEKIEDEKGISDSIIIGDLNADPYEKACLSALGLHGIPIAEIVQRENRCLDGQDYKMFYNPTWNLLGDFNNPPGTYFYDGSIPENSYWHLLDQVLMRPSLNNRFVKDSLRIIDKFADIVLTDERGHPNKKISDHLPIIFEIKEINDECY